MSSGVSESGVSESVVSESGVLDSRVPNSELRNFGGLKSEALNSEILSSAPSSPKILTSRPLPHPRFLLSLLLLPLLFGNQLACHSGESEIVGTLYLGKYQAGLPVYLQLYANGSVDSGAPGITLRETKRLGTTGKRQGLEYRFENLPPGDYLMEAFIGLDDDGTPDLCAPFLEREGPLTLLAGEALRHDLYLLRNKPGTYSISGKVHRGPAALDRLVAIFAWDGPYNQYSSQLETVILACGEGETLDFTLYSLASPSIDLVAWGVDQSDEVRVLYGFSPQNPFRIPKDSTEIKGAEIWIAQQSPDLGSISGQVLLNGPAKNLSLSITSFSGHPDEADSRITGRLEIPIPDQKSEQSFSLQSLPLNPQFLRVTLGSEEPDSSYLQSSRNYGHPGEARAVPLSQSAPHQELSIPFGLGRVSGNIKLSNAPDSLYEVYVMALREGDEGLEIEAMRGFEGNTRGGTFTLSEPYTLFGLDDGIYQMALAPEVSGDGWIADEVASGYVFPSKPAWIEVLGGSRVGADFVLELP